MHIIGSGLAGLLAGVLNESAELYEPLPINLAHRALLRFRSPQIGEAVGIPFREVTAYKGIWYKGEAVPLSPMLMSKYARKVSGKISHRSIRHQTPETRWMAPPDFQERLREMCESRIERDASIYDALRTEGPVISTIPMHILAENMQAEYVLGTELSIVKDIRPIYVSRYIVANCDAFMTNYYPDVVTSPYRASLSGDILIVECTKPLMPAEYDDVIDSFGLGGRIVTEELSNYEQKNGKMVAIDEATRKRFILHMTMEHGIYSLGRFAIWKDVLLDDVFHDIGRIKHFINLSNYDKMKRS